MKYDLVIVGEIYMDHVLTGFGKWPQPGEEVYAQDYVLELGGGAAITACALGRLGRSVSLVGAIGKSEADYIQDRLGKFSVAHPELRVVGRRTGITVSVSSEVERSFFTFLGANAQLEQELAEPGLIEHIASGRHVHFAMPMTSGLARTLIDRLKAAGCTTSLDVGHHETWLQDEENLRTCSMIDYLLPNEREARIICGGDSEQYLKFTQLRGWSNGVVKVGAEGAFMRSKAGTLRAAPPAVRAIDTTGAGDAFNAGFIDALLDEKEDSECLRRGCIVGALSTRAAGALHGLPTREELETCLEECYG